MTYYLVRHYQDGREETIPYTADGTRNAVKAGAALHEPRAVAEYAQIKDCTGKVICTLLSNRKGLGWTAPRYVQLNLFDTL